MAIFLLVLKPIFIFLILKIAREIELNSGGQTTSLVDSFPSFGNWKTNHSTTTAQYQSNQSNGYQQSDS
jgi:hypothetical protein